MALTGRAHVGVWPVAVLLAAVPAGCDRAPEKAQYAHPVPACSTLEPVVARLGMPDPQTQPSAVPSGEANRRDCSFVAAAGTRPPAVGSASILVIRPEVKTDEKDPAKLFGDDFAADRARCTGRGESNPELPSGARCSELWSAHEALVTVTSFAKGAAVRVSVRYADPALSGAAVRTATLAKANSLARSTIDQM